MNFILYINLYIISCKVMNQSTANTECQLLQVIFLFGLTIDANHNLYITGVYITEKKRLFSSFI